MIMSKVKILVCLFSTVLMIAWLSQPLVMFLRQYKVRPVSSQIDGFRDNKKLAVVTPYISKNVSVQLNVPGGNLLMRKRDNQFDIDQVKLSIARIRTTLRTHGPNSSRMVPDIIWMLWDSGWEKAPPARKACLKSWQQQNPNYNVRAISLSEAETLIERKSHYSDTAWKNAAIQAKSDIIRVETLAKYGGIWADASTFCIEQLDHWIHTVLKPVNFFAFERKDNGVKPEMAPWIASWFIASSNTSRIISKWKDEVRKQWSNVPYPDDALGYYWIHRIFKNLTKTDNEFREDFEKMPFMDAAASHCIHDDTSISSISAPVYMYKTTAIGCRHVQANIIPLLAQANL